MTERDVDAIAELEAEARRVAEGISENRESVLSTLDPTLHEEDMRSTALQRLGPFLTNCVRHVVIQAPLSTRRPHHRRRPHRSELA